MSSSQRAAPLNPVPRRQLPTWLRDVLPALVALPSAFATTPFGPSVLDSPVSTGLVLVALAAVVARRYRPRLALLVVLAVVVGALLTVGLLIAPSIGLLVCVYAMARHTDRRTAVVSTLVVVIALVTVTLTQFPQSWELARTAVQITGTVGFAAAAGDATRSRAAYVAALLERAQRAEEGREAEARRRVAEERLSIARDLHDVVAHQIAVINLQAGVASQALRTRPGDAEQSLLTIREAARSVLAEIGGLLRVLRTTGTEVAAPTTLPVPGMAQLEQLLADVGRSGLRVDRRVVGTPVDLDPSVDAVAYRVVQEGLTNAHKHGADASALLQIEYDGTGVEVSVTNTVAVTGSRPRRSSGGHGLVGARERVAAVGGELEAGFGPGPVHRLSARLPARGRVGSGRTA
jgi:signal transduction histidine kinase